PVLHVATFEAEDLPKVISEVNVKGYGLTFGLHTRIDARVREVLDQVRAGNIYVNRNQIGAVVGSQPFGGRGLSGTGPKAGGPLYLRRFRRSASGAEERPADGPAIGAGTLAGLMPDAAGWAKRADRIVALREALRGRWPDALAAAAALDHGPVDLPGPTGEANAYALLPRGRVLCLGAGRDALAAQVIQALAAGNAVLAVGANAQATLQPLLGRGFPLAAGDGTLLPEALQELD